MGCGSDYHHASGQPAPRQHYSCCRACHFQERAKRQHSRASDCKVPQAGEGLRGWTETEPRGPVAAAGSERQQPMGCR